MPRKRIVNLIGQRFGRLLVLEEDMENNEKKAKWICKCDCGNIVSVYGHNLKSGTTKSCGCLYLDRKREKHPRYQTGLSHEPIYTVWCGMKQRCLIQKQPNTRRMEGAELRYVMNGRTALKNFMNMFQSYHITEKMDARLIE